MRMITPYLNRTLASDLFEDVERFFNQWDQAQPARAYDERSFAPACEVIEGEDHYLMSMDIPGMKKEDIKIEMSGNTLIVSGERKRESSESGKVQRYERSYGFFKRAFTLPNSVESANVEARYENGVLELYLPKTAQAKPRQIEIQSGKSGIFGNILGSKKEA